MCLDRPLTDRDDNALRVLVEDMQRGGASERQISRMVAEATCVRRNDDTAHARPSFLRRLTWRLAATRA